jgi:hypothetical protein
MRWRVATLEEALERLRKDPSHPVRAKVGELVVELRVLTEAVGERSAADVFVELGPWAGETTEEILRILADARRVGGHRSVPSL